MKICKKCSLSKENSEFGVRKETKDGLDNVCRFCRNEYYKSRNYDRKSYQKSYKRTISPERKEYVKNYCKLNAHKYNSKKYPHKIITSKIYSILHRILRYKNGRKDSQAYLLLGWGREEFITKFGKTSIDQHIDHIIPVSWFKHDTPICIINNLDNLQLLEKMDNINKGNKYCGKVSSGFAELAKLHIKPEFLDRFTKTLCNPFG